jgi:hypothetical protein
MPLKQDGKNIYCIYTGSHIPYFSSSKEHIIPRSLGGTNQLTLRVDRGANSELGNLIDGKLTKDPFINILRLEKNLLGNSKKPIKDYYAKGKIKGTDIDVTAEFTRSGKRAYIEEIIRSRHQTVITRAIIDNMTVQLKLPFDHLLRLTFTAKTLLAAGYFLFGDAFTSFVDHESLRKLMWTCKQEPNLEYPEIPIAPRINEFKDNDTKTLPELICQVDARAVIVFRIVDGNRMEGSMGIGGTWIGTICFNTNTEAFLLNRSAFHMPSNPELYDLGHVVFLENEGMLLMSYRELIQSVGL